MDMHYYILNFQNEKDILEPSIFLIASTTENKAGNKYAITFLKCGNSSELSSSNVEKVCKHIFVQYLGNLHIL